MSERARIGLLIIIMGAACLVVACLTALVLWQAALEQQKARLTEAAQSQARLIESVVRHARLTQGDGAAALAQVIEAHGRFRGFGETGEFTFGVRRGDSIVFLLHHRHHDYNRPLPVPWESSLAEPMRRALAGQSGTVIGQDYRGAVVLAAHEPVAEMNAGIVAKIDMAEIRAPFLRAALLAGAGGLLVVAAGTWLFIGLTRPLLRKVQASEQRYRTIVETAREGVWIIDRDGITTYANQRMGEILGCAATELPGRTMDEFIDAEARAQARSNLERRRQGIAESHEFRFRRQDGGLVHTIVSASPLFDDSGAFAGALGMVTDITERHQAEERSRMLAAVVENSRELVALADPDGRLLYLNPAGRALLGSDMPAGLADLLAEPSRFAAEMQPQALDRGEWHGELRLNRAAGPPLEAELGLILVRHPGTGAPLCLAAQGRDLTERKRAEAELQMAASVFRHTSEGIFVTDAKGTILSVNPAFTAITGYTPEEAVGGNPRLFKSDRHDDTFYGTMWQALTETGQFQGEIWNRRKNGEAFLEWVTITRVRDATGAPSRYVAMFSDITETRRLDEQIRHQAYHDALTGLPNRYLMDDRLKQALRLARRQGTGVAVMFLDLDRFKVINDTLGHEVGDRLLVEVAERLKTCMRAADTVARLGGDEFVMVLADLADETTAAGVAEKILAEMDRPFLLKGNEVAVTPSLGIALYPADAEDAATLMQRADTAMYQAKAHGRNTYRFFTADMNRYTVARLTLETDLRRAIDRGELELHYQPKMDVRLAAWRGMEALVRWRHPDRGMIPPAEFIPLAEETGLIVPLGEWVLREACRQTKSWQETGLPPLEVAVNVSARQFHRADLPALVEAALAETGLASHWLDIELTESTIMSHAEDTIAVLKRLKGMGVGLSVDDFGTGYSSLSYLKRFPIDALKIDRSFVMEIGRSAEGEAIVSAIINLARALHLDVVAEGVESAAQVDFLRAHHCHIFQGFFFSRPLPAVDFGRRLAGMTEQRLPL